MESLKAEAVERGFAAGGTAEAHHNNAIVACPKWTKIVAK
jgi:hypothetical protein